MAQFGRTSEKWRVRIAASIHVRRSALNCAIFVRQKNRDLNWLSLGCPVLSDDQSLDSDNDLVHTISVFDVVPSRIFGPED